MKKLLLGNEAVARGLYEAGVTVVSSYPGTPSTEITEYASKYDFHSEWAPNEKVAFEVAAGAAIGGARAFCAMKHVGLNVAADPLFTVSYTGINGGLVIAVADDPGMHSSQNEQDSRHYARASKTLMLEPSDSNECLQFTKRAFELSEQYDTPVFIHLSTRISHSQSLCDIGERQEVGVRDYVKNTQKYVMMPGAARGRHVVVEKRTQALRELAETFEFNVSEMNSKEIGVITSGTSYQFAKEALGDSASYLKLGMVYPLPTELIKNFASKVKKLYVLEELDPFFEEHIKALGIDVIGKDKFPMFGEYSAGLIAKVILNKDIENTVTDVKTPVRPPALCPGCPHRATFYVLNKLKVMVSGDIGCYTLGANAPLSAVDTTLCMGASISGLHGFNKARGKQAEQSSVAVIGDSTFMHSGITGLVNTVYNQSNSTILILDNSITGMTGHQQNPTTGLTIKNEPANAVDLEALCRAVGVKRVSVVDPFDMELLESTIKTELKAEEPSVIIVRRPCALLKTVKAKPALRVDSDKCRSCKMCMKIGCPCIEMIDGKAVINQALCVGCDNCVSLCKFGAIGGAK